MVQHETLKAIFALDVAEIGKKKACKRWQQAQYQDTWTDMDEMLPFGTGIFYRRKPNIAWPKFPEGEQG